jgi:gamma-glutamylcyclotransferase (GGCT)/AIG2-like uncharacterized protein YtfP
MSPVLYFAYGSNLCPNERARWLHMHHLRDQDLQPVSLAWLPDHALSFGYRSQRRGGGALDVRSSLGSVVHGALFSVSPAGWRMLDLKEAVAHPTTGYERVSARVVLPDGKLTDAITYRVKVTDRQPHCEPAPGYVETVHAGMDHWSMRPEARTALAAAASGKSGELLGGSGESGKSGGSMVSALMVYGTLMRGELRWPAMRAPGVQRVLMARSRATLHPAAEDPPGEPFPAITLDQPRHVLIGDCVETVDIQGLLPETDRIETYFGPGDARNLYERTLLPVDVGEPGGLPRLAWAYVASPRLPVGVPHASGCWREARGRRKAFLARLVQAHGVANTSAVQGRDAAALIQALEDGALSEWDLAQASGRWTVLAD